MRHAMERGEILIIQPMPGIHAQAELMRWFTEGKLKAWVAGSFDLADYVKAFKLIENRTVVGKAVLVP